MDASEQSPEDKALAAFVKSKLEERMQSGARTAQEGINLTNIAYLCGFDSVFFDGTSRTFKPVPSPSQFYQRNRVHVNRILPTCQIRLAKLCKNPPRWDVRPKSADEEDKDAARLAEQVIIQLWEQQQINRKRITLTMWLQQCGSSYFQVCWDPSLGDKKIIVDDVTDINTGQTVRTPRIVTTGDIRVDVCSFFEIWPDPLAKSWDECENYVKAKIRSLDYFKEQYPETGYLVKEEGCWLNSLTYEQRINAMNVQTGSAGSSPEAVKNSAIEIHWYENPNKKFPYGRHVTVANGVVLEKKTLPIDELPLIKFDDLVIGGKFIGEAIITHLRPLQDQINRGKTMRAAWSNRMLTGKMIFARGHNLAREGGNDQSGEWLAYDPVPNAPEPHALQMPTIPEYSYKEEDTLKEDINDTAGTGEVSRGQTTGSQQTLGGMQLLVEQDDTRVGIETENHEYSYASLGRILLKFVAEYYTDDRLLKIAGEGMEYTVKSFKGDDLKDNFDVHVIRGSTLPGSKVLKRQEIISLHQQGYFGVPTDPAVIKNVLSMLEFGDEAQAWKTQSLRSAQIQRGIAMIEDEGMKPPVSEFDDHAMWLQELNDYRLGEKFMRLAPEQQAIVLEVMNEHADFITQMQGMDQPNPDENPELATTDAAQQAEAKAHDDLGSGLNEQETPMPMATPEMQ